MKTTIIKPFYNGAYTEIHTINIGNRSPKEFLTKRQNQGFLEIPMLKTPMKLKDENGSIEVDNFEIDMPRYILQKEKEYKQNISSMLESKAKELGFDSFYTASAYLTVEDNPLKPLAETLCVWGGNVWGKSTEIQAQVQNGDIDMPQTWEELKAMLPQYKRE